MKKKIAIIFTFIFLLNCITLKIQAFEKPVEIGNITDDPQKIRCTCYIDNGITASGQYTRPGIIAAKKEWIGCVAELNAVNPDGSIGEFIGYYEILDTGYGIETGYGQSKIKKGKTLGTIESGQSVDVWMPTMHQANEWVSLYGDYVYIKIIRGEG